MRIKQGVASAADQAWLSFLSFIVSYAFIRFSSKEEFGTYILVLTPLYLILGVQNSLILSPATTVIPGYVKEDQAIVIETSKSLIFFFALISSISASAGLALYFNKGEAQFSPALTFSFAIAAIGLCAREGSRSLFYIIGNPFAALWADLRYGAILLVSIMALSITSNLTPSNALLSTGVAALLPFAFRRNLRMSLGIDKNALRKMWQCGRWAVIGAIVGWINTSAYPLIVSYTLNADAIADVAAARLFLMPVGLAITAWLNFNRPLVSTWAAQGKFGEIKKLSLRWIIIGFAGITLIAITIAVLRGFLPLILGQNYSNIFSIIIVWTVFFAVNACRSILMASLLVSEKGYKALQAISWLSLFVSMVGLLSLSGNGAEWVVGALIAVETTQCLLIAAKVRNLWKIGNA